jgi:hypothetical protein
MVMATKRHRSLMTLEFLNDATKSHVLFTDAGQLLGDLAALTRLSRRLRHYVNPTLAVIQRSDIAPTPSAMPICSSSSPL